MQIATRTVVHIHYTLTNREGAVLDRSGEGEPLGYLHGAGNIIQGLEDALTGRRTGDRLQVEVAPSDGYGERDEALVQVVPLSAFERPEAVTPGTWFEVRGPAGARPVQVTDVASGQVTIDANHPLAGETLFFEVEVAEVRDATEEELAHGHAHGAGGHDHD
ncbi:MAG: peptidylprolyl isomerase [Ectothiorhodospiraceae bacterium]|nr:peptidylprolyl isomerase [Ectothiorhodospiraceae bacterium]